VKKEKYEELKDRIAEGEFVSVKDKEAFENFIDKTLANVERKQRGSAKDLQVIAIDELGILNTLLDYQP